MKYHYLSILVLFILNSTVCYINIVTYITQSFVWCAGKIFWSFNPCVFTHYVTLSQFRWLDCESLFALEEIVALEPGYKRSKFLVCECQSCGSGAGHSQRFFTLRGEKNQVTFCLPCSISLGVTSLFCDVWGFSFLMSEFYSNILLFLGWVFSLNFWSFLIHPHVSAGLVYGISLPGMSGKCFAAGWEGVGMLVSSLLEMGTTTVHVIY